MDTKPQMIGLKRNVATSFQKIFTREIHLSFGQMHCIDMQFIFQEFGGMQNIQGQNLEITGLELRNNGKMDWAIRV